MLFDELEVLEYGALLAHREDIETLIFVQKNNLRSRKYVVFLASRVYAIPKPGSMVTLKNRDGLFEVLRRGKNNIKVQKDGQEFLVPRVDFTYKRDFYALLMNPRVMPERWVLWLEEILFGEVGDHWVDTYPYDFGESSANKWIHTQSIADKNVLRADQDRLRFQVKALVLNHSQMNEIPADQRCEVKVMQFACSNFLGRADAEGPDGFPNRLGLLDEFRKVYGYTV